jgi:LCP family protein required for cell wall assembly
MSRAGIAAVLSALLPGLGQVWLGARRRGLALALPLFALLVTLVTAILVDPAATLDTLLHPGVLLGVLGLVVGLSAWHVTAVHDAFDLGARQDPRVARSRRRRNTQQPILVVALAGVIAVYGVIELVGMRAYQAANTIFQGPGSSFQIPQSSFGPSPTPGSSPTSTASAPPPTPTPIPVPDFASDGRLNLLLMGSDAGPGRILARTDTMVVLSVDIATHRAALFGIPRNIINVPLPPESAGAFSDGRYPGLLNSLYVYALDHPAKFPGGDARGFRAVTGAIQELIGVPLDDVLVVNLNGFVDLIDAIGGLWVDIPFSVTDAHYPLPDGTGYIEIHIPAGCQKLDGERALEYARSRHQDSDYGRMVRQQRVLVAISKQLDPIAMLPDVPNLLKVARDNIWTTIQPNEIAELAVLAAKVDSRKIEQIRFSPPEYPEVLTTKAIAAIRAKVASVFAAPSGSAAPGPTPVPTKAPKACPRS